MAQASSFSGELKALGVVLDALVPLAKEQQEFVLVTASARLGLSSTTEAASAQGGSGHGEAVGATVGKDATPRDFIKLKKPNSETQRAVCLAYYLTHFREKPHFKTRDITNLNTEAAGLKLSNPARTVDNATLLGGYLAPAGQGNKQITPRGEDVVNALPDQEAVKALRNEGRPKRKKTASRKGRKGKP
jgi:hypothetical protein